MTDFGYSDFLANYELAQTFTWAGGSYTCAIGDRRDQKSLEPGGFAVESDQVIVCGQAQFGATTPQEKDLVTLGGINYRVESVTFSPDSDFIVLNLQNASKGV